TPFWGHWFLATGYSLRRFYQPINTGRGGSNWQSWRVDTGTDDLAYLMACHWPLDEHPGLEQAMLVHYWQGLETEGIHSYGWDDLQYDYRASLIRCLF